MIEKCKDICKDKNDKKKEKCYKTCQKDFPVIIGFYQSKRDKIHPFISDVLIDVGGKELYKQFRTELVHARNLQSIYRFNRERDKQHIMILLDRRFADAYRTYYDRRFRS